MISLGQGATRRGWPKLGEGQTESQRLREEAAAVGLRELKITAHHLCWVLSWEISSDPPPGPRHLESASSDPSASLPRPTHLHQDHHSCTRTCLLTPFFLLPQGHSCPVPLQPGLLPLTPSTQPSLEEPSWS